MKNTVITILILLAFGLSFWGGFKAGKGKNLIQYDTISTTQIKDTTIYEVVKVPTPYFIVDSFPFMVGSDIDTMLILTDYYKKMIYLDTMVNDSIATIIFNGIVYRNELIKSELKYRINKPFTTITQIAPVPQAPKKFNLYAGAQMQGSKTSFDAFAQVGIGKGKTIYVVGYSPFSKSLNAAILWRLH